MSDTKIFSFPDGGTSGGGASVLAMLPALLQRQGVDPNLVALCQGRNSNNGWGGDGIFGILLLFILMGMFNRNGFGGFGGGNSGFMPSAQGGVVPMLNNDANTAVILQSVQRNGYDISSLATALNTSSDAVMAAINALGGQICNLGTQMGQNTNQIVTAVMQGDNGIMSKLCDCCCENRLAICQQTNTLQNAINGVSVGQERGFASLAYENQRQTCDITKAIADSTAQILAGQKAAEFREIQREVNQLRDERTQYQMSALLQQQSQNLINTIRPCPSPSYIVPNPFGCGNYNYPFSNGNCGGNGCGC